MEDEEAQPSKFETTRATTSHLSSRIRRDPNRMRTSESAFARPKNLTHRSMPSFSTHRATASQQVGLNRQLTYIKERLPISIVE